VETISDLDVTARHRLLGLPGHFHASGAAAAVAVAPRGVPCRAMVHSGRGWMISIHLLSANCCTPLPETSSLVTVVFNNDLDIGYV
jgi:hypothetical protein